MTTLLVRGGADAHGRPLDLTIVDGRIATDPHHDPAETAADVLDADGLTVLPGLVDLQVNGAAGIDITATPDRLWDVASVLPRHGVTAFAPTVVTSDGDTRQAALATLQQGPPPGWAGAVPLGLHLEGPMIARARKGAHVARLLVEPTLDLVEGWSREAGVLMVTLAPELPGALEVVAQLVSRGVVVCVGHTDATGDQVEAAAAQGATVLTHLGNAMRPMAARDPGPVGVALAGERLVAGVIADGHHLHPSTLQVYWRALGPGRFLAVSDTTAALEPGPGSARLGEQEVTVADGAVRLADGTLAGSASSLARCLEVLRATTGCSLGEAVATATTTPARVVGDLTRGSLEPGRRGDVTLVDPRAGFDVVATVVGGVVVHGGGR